DSVALRSVQAYNPSTNTWATKAPLPLGRWAPSAGVINGVLYVAGGTDKSFKPATTLFAYNPSTNTWATKAAMLDPGACGAAGVISGKLYVFTQCEATAAFQRYDPATNSWVRLALPANPHRDPAGGVIGGKFYLAGGLDNNGGYPAPYLDMYDPA